MNDLKAFFLSVKLSHSGQFGEGYIKKVGLKFIWVERVKEKSFCEGEMEVFLNYVFLQSCFTAVA